jgi:hypothetical protein
MANRLDRVGPELKKMVEQRRGLVADQAGERCRIGHRLKIKRI